MADQHTKPTSKLILPNGGKSRKQKLAQNATKKLVAQIDAHPEDWDAYYALGTILVEQNSLAQAEELFQKALSLAKDNLAAVDKFNYGLGNVYSAAGKTDQAIATLKLVKNDQTLTAQAQVMIANCYLTKQDYKMAAVFGLTATADKQTAGEGGLVLADALFALEEYGQANAQYQTAATHLKDSPQAKAYFMAGVTYMLLGDKQAADKAIGLAKRIDKDYVKGAEQKWQAAQAVATKVDAAHRKKHG